MFQIRFIHQLETQFMLYIIFRSLIPFATRRSFKIFLSIFFLAGCSSNGREKTETLHEGSYTAKARFVDGRRNGTTELYDNSGRLNSILNYKNDLLSGICIHYFPNGIVADSVMYAYDKPQGYWRHFKEDGDLVHTTFFYFGLRFGPDLWYYKDHILKSFDFLNFEREPIVECIYNTHGNLDSIKKFDLKVMLTDKEKNGSQLVEFFAYLPRIPLTEDFYSIGIADKNHVKQKLCDIEGSNFLIDTLLNAPPSEYHFYLQCEVKAAGGFEEKHTVEMIK